MSAVVPDKRPSRKPAFIENGERVDYTVAWVVLVDGAGRMSTKVVGDSLPLETQLSIAEALQKQLAGQSKAIKAMLRQQRVKH